LPPNLDPKTAKRIAETYASRHGGKANPTPWLDDYIDELAAFPTGAGVHDDAVDSTTQALNYLRHQPVHTWGIGRSYL